MHYQGLIILLTALLLMAAPTQAAPGDILFQEQFNDAADLAADWTVDVGMRVNSISGNPTPALSMEGRRFTRFATSRVINTSFDGANLSFWVQRGFDTQRGNCLAPRNCSEYPEVGDNIRIEYLNSSNNWISLASYAGGGTAGEQFSYSQPLPNDALHSNFQLRFVYISSNTNAAGWDLWHLDNVLIRETVAAPPPVVPAPYADWRMDEDSWDGTIDEVTDSSGNGFEGTAFGTSTTDGFICNAGDFSPTGTSDYLSMDRQAMNGLTDFSISAWVQTRNRRPQALVSGSDGRRHNELIMWWVNFRTFRPWVKNSQNGGQIPARIDDGNWHHVVWTRNGSQNCLYVDGIQQGSCVTRPTAPLSIATGGLIIAQEQDRLGGGFNRFQDWEGKIDELLIFSSALNTAQVNLLRDRQLNGNNWDNSPRSCSGAPVIDHYHIQAADGVACDTIPVTVTAHDAAHNPIDAQGATINLSTDTGRGTFTPSPATFAPGQSGLITSLRYSDLNGNPSESFTINVVDGAGRTENNDSAHDPQITISLSGLRFLNQTDNSTIIPTQVAGVNSPQQLFVQAIRVDTDAIDPSAAACVGLYPPGPVTLRMGGECQNPDTCAIGTIAINGTNLPVNDDNGDNSTTSFGNIPLTFDASSRAPVSINYADVGLVQLHVEDLTNNLTGASNSFVVKPHSMVVTVAESNDATPINGLNAAVPGAGFIPAGTDFRLVVEVQNANGNRTPNYGNETAPETVAVNFDSLVFPTGTGTRNGALNGGTFSNTGIGGQFESTTASWSEVGTFTVNADVGDDGNYLGGGGVDTLVESSNIGRFYPADFALSGAAINTVCEASPSNSGAFSYLSQPNLRLSYTLIARNAQGTTVSNYDNENLNYGVGAASYHAENANNGTDLSTRVSVIPVSPITWSSGIYRLDNVPGQLNRAANPDGPFNTVQMSLSVIDPDGAALESGALDQNPATTDDCADTTNCTSAGLGSTQIFRYGRLVIDNANGPESSPLPVNFGTQFWNGTNFVDTTNDVCSTLAFSALTYDTSNPVTNPQPVTVGSGTSNGTLNLDTIGSSAATISGSFGLSFSAPNDTGQFPVSVNLANYPWFRFDWDQDGDFDSETLLPPATINFGSYRGHDRVIYWREQF